MTEQNEKNKLDKMREAFTEEAGKIGSEIREEVRALATVKMGRLGTGTALGLKCAFVASRVLPGKGTALGFIVGFGAGVIGAKKIENAVNRMIPDAVRTKLDGLAANDNKPSNEGPQQEIKPSEPGPS